MARGIDVCRKYGLPPEEGDEEVKDAFAELPAQDDSVREFEPETILKGKVLRVVNDEVIVDIGYKSEGVIPLYEFGENADVDVGDEIEVLLEEIDEGTGMIRLSKRKADRIRAWNEILMTAKEGDVVRGIVQRRIDGGFLVDIGVPVFLPAGQVSLDGPDDGSECLGKEVEARIIKIDEQRMNIVVSRRKLLESLLRPGRMVGEGASAAYFASHPWRKATREELDVLNRELELARAHSTGRSPIVYFDRAYAPVSLDLHGFDGLSATESAARFLRLADRRGMPVVNIICGRDAPILRPILEGLSEGRLFWFWAFEWVGFWSFALHNADPSLWVDEKLCSMVSFRALAEEAGRELPWLVDQRAGES